VDRRFDRIELAREAQRDETVRRNVRAAELTWLRHPSVSPAAAEDAEAEPVIAELSREGDRVRVVVETRVRPDAQGLDVFQQPWLFAAAPRAAFEGKPQVELEVRGQAKGSVKLERD